MKTLSIIPVKNTARAKSRLSQQLGPQERESLVFSLLLRTIRTVKSCFEAKDILIVGLDPEVERLAKKEGLTFLKETGRGLNRALHQATVWATKHGFEAILISPLDLPFLSPKDIQSIVNLGSEGGVMVIAPDKAYQGTNILLLNPVISFKFCFGPGSYQRHLKQSEFCGLKQKMYYSFGTCFDLDDYDGYQVWQNGELRNNNESL